MSAHLVWLQVSEFSRSNSEMELIARRVIAEEEGENVDRTVLDDYADPDSDRYHKMVEKSVSGWGLLRWDITAWTICLMPQG